LDDSHPRGASFQSVIKRFPSRRHKTSQRSFPRREFACNRCTTLLTVAAGRGHRFYPWTSTQTVCGVLCISSVFVARCLCLLLLLCLCLSSVWSCISQISSVVPRWCWTKLVRDRLLDFPFFLVFFRFSCFALCSRRLESCCDPNWCFVWKSTNYSEHFRVRISELGVFFPEVFWKVGERGVGRGEGGDGVACVRHC
jgi:hypothetical protein